MIFVLIVPIVSLLVVLVMVQLVMWESITKTNIWFEVVKKEVLRVSVNHAFAPFELEVPLIGDCSQVTGQAGVNVLGDDAIIWVYRCMGDDGGIIIDYDVTDIVK